MSKPRLFMVSSLPTTWEMFWEKASFPLLVRSFLNSSNMNTIDLKIFPNHGGICILERKFNKISGECYCKAPKGFIEICIFNFDPEGLVGWQMTPFSPAIFLILTCCLRNILKKRGQKNKGIFRNKELR